MTKSRGSLVLVCALALGDWACSSAMKGGGNGTGGEGDTGGSGDTCHADTDCAPGEVCDRVPAESLCRLSEQGLIVPVASVRPAPPAGEGT